MPPRYVYWTILIDQQPTAFRAKAQADLLPTLHQLRRTNTDVVLKWFARGRLWDSPEAERAAQRIQKVREKRGPDWRPGGSHKDPRARFDHRARPKDRRRPHDRHADAGRGDSSSAAPETAPVRKDQIDRAMFRPKPNRPRSGPPRRFRSRSSRPPGDRRK